MTSAYLLEVFGNSNSDGDSDSDTDGNALGF
jgi:hypothetical protein